MRALSCGPDIVPLVGGRRGERLAEALGAMMLTDDLQQIERTVPVNAVAGDRYVAARVSALDSEASVKIDKVSQAASGPASIRTRR